MWQSKKVHSTGAKKKRITRKDPTAEDKRDITNKFILTWEKVTNCFSAPITSIQKTTANHSSYKKLL